MEAKKRKKAHVEFTGAGAERTLEIVDKKDDPAHPAHTGNGRFQFPGMLDMQSALLYIRSLPLAAGDLHALITMTAGNPYLTTVKVVGRGQVKTVAGRYRGDRVFDWFNARSTRTENWSRTKRFKSARAWVSDDNDRLIVKAEAQVFIGTVTLDLVQVSFPEK